MTKKAALKRSSLARPVRALSPIRHQGAALPTLPVSPFAQTLLAEACEATGSNSDPLNTLVENIVENLSEGGEDRAQMKEFLTLLLDTDPSLGEEILAGISERK